MNTFSKTTPYYGSIGFYIQFSATNTPYFRYSAKTIGPYRYTLNISLPESKSEKWLAAVKEIVGRCEKGHAFPLRLDWNNAKDYFTLDQLEELEKDLVGISMYLYGVPSHRESYLHSLWRAKRAENSRTKYHSTH